MELEWQRGAAEPAAQWAGAALSDEFAGLSPMVQLLKAIDAAGGSTRAGTAQVRPEAAASAAPAAEFGLPTFTYSHECRLLREPWPSAFAPAVLARPCLFGAACQGMSPSLPGHAECGGVVLTEAMTPEELLSFESVGALPCARRACVLCCRFATLDAYMYLNKTRSAPCNMLLNWYVNPVNCEDGYASKTCLPLHGEDAAWSGVYGHVAAASAAALRLRRDATPAHRWYVDQSALKWRPDF